MRYRITHATHYTYSHPVGLFPHTLRLRPRCDGTQSLQSFRLRVDPSPVGLSDNIDLDGNATTCLWFDRETSRLEIETFSEVETRRSNPFQFVLEPWANTLPIDYPAALYQQLRPYLSSPNPFGSPDPIATQLAYEVGLASDWHVVSFLSNLSQRIYQECQYLARETGNPLPAGIVWQQKLGSCRDLTVLFMACCRALGLAARFVSGYQEGDVQQRDRDLHAWAEVYLPGAGWRGYDPTHGLAVGDRHIPLAAAALPQQTAPIAGKLRASDVRATLRFEIDIARLDGEG